MNFSIDILERELQLYKDCKDRAPHLNWDKNITDLRNALSILYNIGKVEDESISMG